jgi:hypothetical protein
MPTFSIQRGGFIRVPELYAAIVADMVANGFVQKFPASPLPAPVAGTDYAKFKVTLEAGANVDPLHADQPWRIVFDCVNGTGIPGTSDQVGNIYVATPLQLANDGTIAFYDKTDGTVDNTRMPAGMLNTKATMPQSYDLDNNYSEYHFVYRADRLRDKAAAQSYPMSYRLSITDHGIALAIWEDGTDVDTVPQFQWMLVQRPVDHITGAPRITGHCPLFCVYGMKGAISKFVVRENDILKPTPSWSATANTEDSAAIINSQSQVAITEDNRYVMTFPNGLNTARYVYTEELDMIAYTSADVVSQFSDVPMTVYGEATPRKYKALNANGKFNTGMRIMMIMEGGSRS